MRKGRWTEKNPDEPADVSAASKDFELRAKDENCLSVYGARSTEEGRAIAAVYRVCVLEGRPDGIDYMLFPSQLLIEASIALKPEPTPDLPEFFSSRHWVMPLPDQGVIPELIRRLLTPQSGALVERLSKAQVTELAKEVISQYPELIDAIGEHWRALLIVP